MNNISGFVIVDYSKIVIGIIIIGIQLNSFFIVFLSVIIIFLRIV